MKLSRMLSIAVLAIGVSALAPAYSFAQDAAVTAPVRPVGRMHFWFYSRDAAERFLTEDHEGVSAITYAGRQDAALKARISASGLAYVGGVGGIVRINGQSVEDGIKVFKKRIDKIIADGVDAIYVDEPVGPALIGECGADCYDAASLNTTDKGVRFLVDAFNELGDYFRTKRPGGQIGICVGDGGGLKFHEAALAAGLREDFVCLEQYAPRIAGRLTISKRSFPTSRRCFLPTIRERFARTTTPRPSIHGAFGTSTISWVGYRGREATPIGSPTPSCSQEATRAFASDRYRKLSLP